MASLTAKANTGAGTDALAGYTTPDGFAGDAPDWREPFYRRQIDEYEGKLAVLAEQVRRARKPRRKPAAIERVEAVLDDLRDDPVISVAGFDAIEAALARFIDASNAASALAALQAIEAERQRVVRARRRRDDEAVIALLMH